jgi:hypothetical protein
MGGQLDGWIIGSTAVLKFPHNGITYDFNASLITPRAVCRNIFNVILLPLLQ